MKEVEFDSVDMSAEEFREVICECYPKLKNADGYMFFLSVHPKLQEARTTLEKCVFISSSLEGESGLSKDVHQTKRIWIWSLLLRFLKG